MRKDPLLVALLMLVYSSEYLMKTKTSENKDGQGQGRSNRLIAALLINPNHHRVCQYQLARQMEHFLRRPQTDTPSWIFYSESKSNIILFNRRCMGALLKNLLTNVLVFLQGLPIFSTARSSTAAAIPPASSRTSSPTCLSSSRASPSPARSYMAAGIPAASSRASSPTSLSSSRASPSLASSSPAASSRAYPGPQYPSSSSRQYQNLSTNCCWFYCWWQLCRGE